MTIDNDQNFFGRREAIDLLRKRISDCKEGCRQNVALLGAPFVGKSSLLQYLYHNSDDTSVVTVYLDLENKDFSYFCIKFITCLLYDFGRIKNIPLHDDISLLMESLKKTIPHSIELIRGIQKNLTDGKWNDCYLGLLMLIEVFTAEANKCCVLMIDEFQVIDSFGLPHAFQVLGKKIMTQKKCLYIIASSHPTQAREILGEKLSLLFGSFEEVEIFPLDPQVSQDFIGFHLKDLRISELLKSFLADFCGGYPLYLNLICQELINLSAVLSQSEVYLPILTQAVEDTIFNRWGVISRHFELIINELCHDKHRPMMSSVLMVIANGKSKFQDIVDETGFSKSQVNLKINRLLEQGVVRKNGNYYYFQDKLFKYWVKYVFQRRLKDVVVFPEKQRLSFNAEFYAIFDNFKLCAQKTLPDRIVDLLMCFDNESFDLNGRKYKLPVFSEVEIVQLESKTGGVFDAIMAKTAEQSWFIITKKEHLAESDVSEILLASQKIPRPERCVIISLAHIEDNVRIRALQEHFWVWNECELNILLALFDKPLISI
ncbi:MAG: AAA family ATPase [Candidatus Omnitrophica bacterium]|nr:AAA family ATPase [Candidatus Omnitrophota bacterium]